MVFAPQAEGWGVPLASIPYATGTDRGEARFFFVLACAMAATIVAGFSLNLALGRSSFDSPLVVHVHALLFMGWVGIFLTQNALVFAGNLALHRRLGWIAAIWVPAMVLAGLAITRYSLQQGGGAPFFDQNQFLISNPLHLLGFAGLAGCAIARRRDTDWHRRLMFCSFTILTGPGIGRLLPNPLLIPYAWYASIFVPVILFIGAGMVADKRRHGRVHPAWLWGFGLIVGLQVIADLIAYSPPGYQFTEWFLAGTPGAERQMEAFFPPQ